MASQGGLMTLIDQNMQMTSVFGVVSGLIDKMWIVD